jgi:hypothetical protein
LYRFHGAIFATLGIRFQCFPAMSSPVVSAWFHADPTVVTYLLELN